MTTSSPSTTEVSPQDQHKRARFALLAQVGRQKKQVSTLLEALQDSFTNVTGLVAGYTALLHWVEELESQLTPQQRDDLVTHSSLHTRSIKQLLYSLPGDTLCRDLSLKMLDSDGLGMALDVTTEGYVSPSGDQILRNVARAIEATSTE